jgi:hypothetical protein
MKIARLVYGSEYQSVWGKAVIQKGNQLANAVLYGRYRITPDGHGEVCS